MATKTVTAQLDDERYAELKDIATRGIKGEKLTIDQAASLVLNTGLSRRASIRAYNEKQPPKAAKPRAAAAKSAKAAKPAKAEKKAAKAAPKGVAKKVKAKGEAKPKASAKAAVAPQKKSGAVKVERKRTTPIAAKKTTAAAKGLGPQRPQLPAPIPAANGTPVTTTEVAQA